MSNQIASADLKQFLKLASPPLGGDRTQARSAVRYLEKLKRDADPGGTGSGDTLASFPPFIYIKDNGDPDLSGFPQAHLHLENVCISPIHLRESNNDHKREPVLSTTLKHNVLSQSSP